MNALSPLGMVSDVPSKNQSSDAVEAQNNMPAAAGQVMPDHAATAPAATDPAPADRADACDEVAKDYFVERDGVRFAGTHLLLDLWGARNLTDPALIDTALRAAAEAAGATILHGHFHHFSPNGGVSGVLVLAESHISIHTWPERDFAAVDIFMCGACNPYRSIETLKGAFAPTSIQLSEQRRGLIV
ncbi:adenosylmethionine decarboxylase [Acidisphaera rubrifaciens]|uniref:S-adenosylmethionine decarboxylase proenzyme n=1 Tax=Acidisphaera rubrifaciens HS-AP3 TaxID=1231350 RepID=A0A0D6PAF2_9PROT|nr:adenosylmethionine decarboxylase [Acidisphaera rubrifaciens]GAN78173.1 S-adenosylmethionine decarboxylase proenzyme [Acidisphaera rubrifaciens HS-AP3]